MKMQASPLVSVVVMTFNRPEQLKRCLASLAAQTLGMERFEVILVDSSTPTVDVHLEPFRDHLVIHHHAVTNRGVAANRNFGADQAVGDVLAFLDDDCIASPGWLAQLLMAVQRDSMVLAAASVVHADPQNVIAAAGQIITEIVNDFYNPLGKDPRFLPGLNFALERDRYHSLGGCDSRFGLLAAEDRDFIDRWLHRGGRLKLLSACHVHHDHRCSLRGFVRQYFNYGRGAWRFHR